MYHPAPMTRRTTENGDADGRGGSARRARRLVQKAEGVVATIVKRPGHARERQAERPPARRHAARARHGALTASDPERKDAGRLLLDHLRVGRLHGEPGAVGEDLLDLDVVVESVVAELPAHAALLVTAPDALHRLGIVVPYPDRPGADAAGHPESTRVVRTPHAGNQPEIHRVRQVNRFRFVLERRHRHYRAEDLLLPEPRRIVDGVEDRGLDVVAVVVVATLELVAAGDQPESLLHAVLDELVDDTLLVAGDERPHVRRLTRWSPNLDLAGEIGHPVEKAVVDSPLYEHTCCRTARLPGVAEHPEDGGARGGLDVGVVEDHERGLAAQFQADPLHLQAGLGTNPLPGPRLAREGDLVHLLARDELGPDDRPRPWYQVEHAPRDSRLLDELHQLVGRRRRVACRLDDDRAARSEGGSHLSRRLRQREVPGGDHPDHADRFLDQVDHRAARQREALAVELASETGVELEDVGRGADVRPRLPHRHTHLQAHDPRQTVCVLAHQVGGAREHLLPELVVVDPVAHVSVERGAGCVDRGAGVGLGPLLGLGGNLPDIGRILSRELAAARGFALLAVDDQGAEEGQAKTVLCCHGSLLQTLGRFARDQGPRAPSPGYGRGYGPELGGP